MTLSADTAVDISTARSIDLTTLRQDRGPRATRAINVAIGGLGYAGLPTALAFHAAGCNVVGLDIATARLADIREGAADLVPSDVARPRGTLTATAFEISDDLDLLAGADAV